MMIRKGDTVVILAGKDKGKRGTIEAVMRDSHQVVVNGINIMKRHIKPNSKHPSGGILEVAFPIDWSNVAVVDADTDTKKQTKSSTKTKPAKAAK